MTDRPENGSTDYFEFGPFHLDTGKRVLYRAGEFVPLTPKAVETLIVLVEDAGHVITREQLLARIWPDAFVEEGSISNNISALRKVLNPHFDGEGPIATVARRGYRFIAPVRLRSAAAEIALTSPWLAPASPESEAREPRAPAIAAADDSADDHEIDAVSIERQTPPPARRLMRYGVLGLAAIVIVALAVSIRFTSRSRSSSAAPTQRRSIAVLAMKNLSAQPEQSWLSTALTETIGAELTAGGQLRLVPTANVARMQQELAPPAGIGLTRKQLDEIGRDLGCDWILSGDYLAVGDKIRVDVRLDEVTTGESIARASVTDRQQDLLTLVGRAGTDLRSQLRVAAPGSRDLDAAHAQFPTSPEATRIYFQGLDALRLRDNTRAATLLQQATAAEPNFALAHSALSTTWLLLGYDRRAAGEARLAFDLSDKLSREDRLSVEAQSLEASFKWQLAADRYQQLWQAYPDNIEYGLKLANSTLIAGHPQDAQRVIDEMRRLSPPDGSDPRIDLVQATVAERAGDSHVALAAATRAADKALAEKATLLLARARLKQGIHLGRLGDGAQALARYGEARALFQSLDDNGGVADGLRYEGSLMAERGELDAAEKKLAAALVLAQPLHYVRLTTEILNQQSYIARLRGALAASLRAAEAALASAREADDQAAVGRSLLNIGVVVKLQGDYARARAVAAEAEQILRKAGSNMDADGAVNNLLTADLAQGRLSGLRPRFEALLATERKGGVTTRIATRLVNLSRLRMLEGDLQDAERLTIEECGLYESTVSKANLASCHTQLALIQYHLGRPADARAVADMVNMADLKRSPQPPTDLARLARLYLWFGDTARASAMLAEATRSLAGRDYIPEQAIATDIGRAMLEVAMGTRAAATDRLRKAQQEAERVGLTPLVYDSRLALAELAEPAAGRSAAAQLAVDARHNGLGLYAVLVSRLEAGAKTPLRVSSAR